MWEKLVWKEWFYRLWWMTMHSVASSLMSHVCTVMYKNNYFSLLNWDFPQIFSGDLEGYMVYLQIFFTLQCRDSLTWSPLKSLWSRGPVLALDFSSRKYFVFTVRLRVWVFIGLFQSVCPQGNVRLGENTQYDNSPVSLFFHN